ncbi:tyrosine-type recombinase/integrase [Deinococcus radiopugnans]|uniref:Integrase n=1 Tax=Deinococcus radiopugnans ATCC 19172 TaxID=585398 RepID=A0A5C4Y8Y2_9DEIO|nr:site-specific integrase [Deinococcus radiopugnans]MBB6016920.1 integrase [Deinococcus radiopugnans ATCC 19172]TNM71473.1 site-specific integrase [Deinococcus radiopugnans ATCC 19172]
MGKRANGEGTITARKKNGVVVGYLGAVIVGYGKDGHADRRWVSGKTKQQVVTKMERLKAQRFAGTLVPGQKWTLSKLLEHHHQLKEQEGIKPNTVRSYRDTTRLVIAPYLGHIELEKLRALDVSNWLTTLQREGKSPRRREYALRVLKMALRQAERLELVNRNVAAGVRPPRVQQQEMKCWTLQEANAFTASTQDHRLHAAFYLALTTGLRRGEILGLQWRDINWQTSQLKVRHNLVEVRGESEGRIYQGKQTVSKIGVILQSPKTRGSRRTIPLSPKTMDKLRAHQRQQHQEKANAAEGWTESDFVFASTIGTPTHPRNFYTVFIDLVTASGLPRIRMHDLRHTAASLMFQRGLPIKTIAQRLGHASVAFTLNVYTHLYEEQKSEAAFDLDD